MCGITYTSVSGNSLQRVSIYSLRKSYIIGDKLQDFPDGKFQILNSSAKVQELRLDPNDRHTAFGMEMIYQSFGDNYVESDSIDIWYTPETHYIDMECGCTVYFTIDSIRSTNNLITNAILKNKEVVNNGSQINIELEY